MHFDALLLTYMMTFSCFTLWFACITYFKVDRDADMQNWAYFAVAKNLSESNACGGVAAAGLGRGAITTWSQRLRLAIELN